MLTQRNRTISEVRSSAPASARESSAAASTCGSRLEPEHEQRVQILARPAQLFDEPRARD